MEIQNIENENHVPIKKRFKDYYINPEFRARHLSYMMEKVQCPDCGLTVSRCNMSKHKSSKRHIQIVKGKKEAIDPVLLKNTFLEALQQTFGNFAKPFKEPVQ